MKPIDITEGDFMWNDRPRVCLYCHQEVQSVIVAFFLFGRPHRVLHKRCYAALGGKQISKW